MWCLRPSRIQTKTWRAGNDKPGAVIFSIRHAAGWLRSGIWLGLLPAAALLVMLMAPLGRLMLAGFAGDVGTSVSVSAEGGSLWSPWQDDYLRWRVLWSLLQAGATCALALLLGLPLAWVLARFEFSGRTLVLRLLMLPFVVPTLVAALGCWRCGAARRAQWLAGHQFAGHALAAAVR